MHTCVNPDPGCSGKRKHLEARKCKWYLHLCTIRRLKLNGGNNVGTDGNNMVCLTSLSTLYIKSGFSSPSVFCQPNRNNALKSDNGGGECDWNVKMPAHRECCQMDSFSLEISISRAYH
jgi:hypothetical protein